MNLRIRTLLWCACVEAPLLGALIYGESLGLRPAPIWLLALGFYHFIPILIMGAFSLWCCQGDAPPSGPISYWHAVYWCLIFLIQIFLTFPVGLHMLKKRAIKDAA
jgi:hypothetical protein